MNMKKRFTIRKRMDESEKQPVSGQEIEGGKKNIYEISYD